MMGFYRRLFVRIHKCSLPAKAKNAVRWKAEPFGAHCPSVRIVYLHAMTSQTAQMCTFTLLLRALIVCFSLKCKIGHKRVVNRLFEVKRNKYKHIKTRLCTCHQQSVPRQKYGRHRCQLFLFTLRTRAVTIVNLTLQPTQNFGLLPTLR